MFYKLNTDTGEWYFGNEVHFPDGTKINAENKESKDGWQWHDKPPQEYLEWIENQNTPYDNHN
jgi:hypothetical protein